MKEVYVSVRVLNAPFHIDRPYDYLLPPAMTAPRGSLVRVPFGGGNRTVFGVVVGVGAPREGIRIKPVSSVLDAAYALSEELLGLCLFLSDYYLCSFGDAVRTVLPHVTRQDAVGGIRTVTLCSTPLTTEEVARLTDPKTGGKPLRSPAHRRILQHLLQVGETPRDALCAALSVTTAQVRALSERGYITLREQEWIRNPYASFAGVRDTAPILLSRAQTAAYDALYALYRTGAPRAALLHGVTGSGKTKIMLSLIDRVLSDGKTVIMMVPEIALTPQTVRIFCSRYGERVAVIHSSLTPGERCDAWRRIRRGDVDLVIGTRSAVFAPLEKIGLIILDEEHEHTYKSEQDPKYHTRDVAAYRAGTHNALMVLASATPSFESYYKAKRGQYTLVELTERYGGAVLPRAEIVDMRTEMRTGNVSPLSRRLYQALEEVGERGEQAILFLNRRGYNASLHCKNCGTVFTCPHCSVAMAYHAEGGGHLLCHLCGTRLPVPKICRVCGSDRISYIGFGTQKVESEIAQQLPDRKLIRMDADTANARSDYETMLESFRSGGADILLGTQMVSKGHDFPRVTLVGILLADTGMYVNDFRASERTFSLLTQVIGRAGRAETPGVALIQTFSPENDVIRLAREQDYPAFYASEIQLREKLAFPPFSDMVQMTFSSGSETATENAAKACFDEAKRLGAADFSDIPLQLFGPMEAQVYKLAEQYRRRIVFKCRWGTRSRLYFRTLLLFSGKNSRVNTSIDINPMHA